MDIVMGDGTTTRLGAGFVMQVLFLWVNQLAWGRV